MRICVLALAAGAALALPTPGFSQMAGYPGPQSFMDGSQNGHQYLPNDHALPQAYLKKVTALSYRTLELRAEDGGKLTPEHLASLQRELNALARQYRVRADFRIKAG
jgi:hypothetical protein